MILINDNLNKPTQKCQLNLFMPIIIIMLLLSILIYVFEFVHIIKKKCMEDNE